MVKTTFLFVIFFLLLSSCRTIGTFPSISGGGGNSESPSAYGPHDLAFTEFQQVKRAHEVEGCEFIAEGNGRGGGGVLGLIHAKQALQNWAAAHRADTIVFSKDPPWSASKTIVHGKVYRCGEKLPEVEEINRVKYESHDNNDLTVSVGQYIERHGVLKKIGEMGPTIGFEFAAFSPFIKYKDKKSPNSHGFFVLWTLDYVWNTEGNLFRPEFRNQDYTNYMLGGGYAFRRVLPHNLQLHYRGGLAINFLEIDTFRTNGDQNDSKYTDTTISTIHKLGIDLIARRIKDQEIYKKSQIRFGPSLFFYYSPDVLGKFKTADSGTSSPGGSLALLFDVKFEFY